MAPEQALRQRVDARADIFALGVVLYEITVGKRLFKGPAQDVFRRLTEGVIEPPTFVRRDFPGALEAIVMRALERHPGDRYQTAYDLADDLEEFLRAADLHSGPVRVARYLDELAEAAGGQRRHELTPERERGPVDAELDFDSQVFAGYAAAPGGAAAPSSEWDEYDERDEAVAAARGVGLDRMKLLRTPVPSPQHGAGDDQGGHGGHGGQGGGAGGPPPTIHREIDADAAPRLPLRAPESQPVRMPPAMLPPQAAARPPTAPPGLVVQVAGAGGTDAAIPTPPPEAMPYLALGALALAIVGALLYFLL
jgi:hypothetical protein